MVTLTRVPHPCYHNGSRFPGADVTCLSHMLECQRTGLDPRASASDTTWHLRAKRGPQGGENLDIKRTASEFMKLISGISLFFALSPFTHLGNLIQFPSALPLEGLWAMWCNGSEVETGNSKPLRSNLASACCYQ